TRKTGAGDVPFVPGAIGPLRAQQITQAALHTRPIEIAARTNAHDGPRRLRRRAFAFAFQCRVFVRNAGLAPTAVIVLAALQPIAPAQDPILGHVFADGAQTAEHLPGAVNIIHSPAPVPRAVVILGIDQVADRVADRALFRVEVDVTEKLEGARGQIAAGRIKDCV